jgi:hypothetical protein
MAMAAASAMVPFIMVSSLSPLSDRRIATDVGCRIRKIYCADESGCFQRGSPVTLPFVLAPLFIQVVLTFGLGFWLAANRTPLVRSGAVKPREIDLRQPNWPRQALQIGNSYSSQFEAPVLFYVLTVLAIMTKQAEVLFVALSWVFVLSRLGHAYVHVTSNDLRLRKPLFGVGAAVLAIMWLIFAAKILLELP